MRLQIVFCVEVSVVTIRICFPARSDSFFSSRIRLYSLQLPSVRLLMIPSEVNGTPARNDTENPPGGSDDSERVAVNLTTKS